MKMVKTNTGFTLMEMIIVVLIMGVVSTLAFPDFVRFFQMQQQETERTALEEIQKSLELYARSRGTIPAETTWAAELSEFSVLNAESILYDTSGVTRTYIPYAAPAEAYRAADGLVVQYAAVIAAGDDQTFNASYSIADAGEYSALEASGDDMVIKYTDRAAKVESYELTLERLNAISEVLSNYASYKQNEQIIAGAASATQWIYVPRSMHDGGGSDSTDMYPGVVLTEMATFLPGGANEVNNAANDDAARRGSMQGLMRMLGLPENYCCSALELDSDGNPKAFFYYSNPRARNIANPTIPATHCETRATLADPKLAPRVTVEADVCG